MFIWLLKIFREGKVEEGIERPFYLDDTFLFLYTDIGADILIHAKALIELGLSLGTLVRNPVFQEAEPEFDEVAYFKTEIGLTNSPKVNVCLSSSLVSC